MSQLVIGASPEAVEQAGWSISVDGQLVRAGRIMIANPRFGVLSFGKRPEGTIGWGWRGVGGVGIVPWTIFDGKLLIGYVDQARPFIAPGVVANIPRGFAKIAATFAESAAEELREEVGLRGDEWVKRLVPLGNVPVNADSTFFDTTDGRGFRFFGFEVRASEIEDRDGRIGFKRELIERTPDLAEWITGCAFSEWDYAALLEDNFSSAGVARLIATRRELIEYL